MLPYSCDASFIHGRTRQDDVVTNYKNTGLDLVTSEVNIDRNDVSGKIEDYLC